MKHRLPTFLAGMATTLLISGLTITALAAAETITFTTTVNSVNIEVNGVRVAAMGEDYRLEDNTMTPNSISYNNTTYVPIRRFGEVMGVEIGWNQGTHSVMVGGSGAATLPAGAPTPEAPKAEITVINSYEDYKSLWEITRFESAGRVTYNGRYGGTLSSVELLNLLNACGTENRISYATRLAGEVRDEYGSDWNSFTTGDWTFVFEIIGLEHGEFEVGQIMTEIPDWYDYSK